MLISRKDNNEYLLIDGTDQPQRDAEGNPIPNPHYGEVTTFEVPDPEVFPRVLQSSDFFSYCWSKLGSGDVGMARFQEIQDDAFAAGGAAKSASRQIDRLADFSKEQAQSLLTPIKTAGCMNQAELDGILNDWPTTGG
jgi:hypothetical protein